MCVPEEPWSLFAQIDRNAATVFVTLDLDTAAGRIDLNDGFLAIATSKHETRRECRDEQKGVNCISNGVHIYFRDPEKLAYQTCFENFDVETNRTANSPHPMRERLPICVCLRHKLNAVSLIFTAMRTVFLMGILGD